MDYVELAAEVVRRAGARGAEECDCIVEAGRELTIKVRHGEVESIERADFRGLGIRVFTKKSLGFGFTTDFSAGSIDDLVERSCAFARTATPDPDAGIAEFEKTEFTDLDLNDTALEETSLSTKTEMALACEQAAYDCDERIKHTYGTSYSDQSGRVILARTGADPIFYEGTHVDLTCVPVAEDAGERRMGIWLSAERFISDLDPAATVGTIAAQRAVSMLGAKTVPTQKAAVVFDPRTGSQVVANIFESLDGERMVKGMSFLKDKIGHKVGTDLASSQKAVRLAHTCKHNCCS